MDASAQARTDPAPPAATRVRVLVTLAAAVLLGLLGSGVLVWRGTSAVFTATTSNPANSWTAGTVSLADDDSGVALFSASGLLPGDSTTNCLTVDYTGDVPTAVKVYAAGLNDASALAQHVDLTIEEGTGGGFGDCTGFTPDATVYTGTVAAFAAGATDYGTGVGSWAPTAAQAAVYRIVCTLNASTPSSKQGTTTSMTFRWESQS